MDLTRRLFLELLTVPLLLPPADAEGAGLPPACGAEGVGLPLAGDAVDAGVPVAGDDLPAFSEFAESQFATQWDQTP